MLLLENRSNERPLKGFDERNQFLFAFFSQVYDTATCYRILTFNDPNSSNNYSKNLATFNPTDDLVLNDGVLWDVKGNRVIHKFDKFNNFVSGVFHPSGLEIIINSEIVSFYLATNSFDTEKYASFALNYLFLTAVDVRLKPRLAQG